MCSLLNMCHSLYFIVYVISWNIAVNNVNSVFLRFSLCTRTLMLVRVFSVV